MALDGERLQPSASLSGDSGPALTSWKEIADFFNRHVRTVQRWEREEGLPVHRHPHQKQSSVYAFPGELEAWWRGRSAALEANDKPSPARWRHAIRDERHREGRVARWIAGAAAATLLLLLGAFALSAMQPRDETRPDAPALAFTTLVGSVADGWLAHNSSGDFNGDGVDDLVLAADEAGRLYLLFGAENASLRGDPELTAGAVINGSRPGQWHAEGLGDLNGDGIDDLVVGHSPVEPASLRGSGTIYIVFGRSAWPRRLDVERDADVTIGSTAPNDIRMAPCGRFAGRTDLNGDGVDDLLIGASEYTIGEAKSAGAVFAILGRDRWPPTLELAEGAHLAIFGTRSGEGLSACATGDLDGDELTDLVVAAGEGTLWNLLGGDEKIYAFSGRAQWPAALRLTDADWKGRAERPGEEFSALAIGDLDGDGRDDVIAAWPTDRDDPAAPGQLRVWLGRDQGGAAMPREPAPLPPGGDGLRATELAGGDGFRPPDRTIEGPTAGGRFGAAIALADLDRDGADDLLIGAPGNETLDVVFGGRPPDAALEPVALFRHPTLASMSYLMTVADLNDDGLVEVVLTVPDASVGATPASGMAFVLRLFAPMRVDVRPDAVPNAVLVPHGVCAVRIYGEAAGEPFIDPASIRFLGAAPTNVVVEDYDGDGFLDLQAYFDNATLELALGTESAVITARTRAGFPAGGADAIVVVPNDSGQ